MGAAVVVQQFGAQLDRGGSVLVRREFGASRGGGGGSGGSGGAPSKRPRPNDPGAPAEKDKPKKTDKNCGKGQKNQNIGKGLIIPSMVLAPAAWWYLPSSECAEAKASQEDGNYNPNDRSGGLGTSLFVLGCSTDGQYNKNDLLVGGIDPPDDMQDDTGMMDDEAVQIEALQKALDMRKQADATCDAFLGNGTQTGIFSAAKADVKAAEDAAKKAKEHAEAGEPTDEDVRAAQTAADDLHAMSEKHPDPSGDSATGAVERMDRQINELKGIANSAQARKDKGLKYTKETVVVERGRQDAIAAIESCRKDLSDELRAIGEKTKQADEHLDEANAAKRKGEDQHWAERVESTLFGDEDDAGLFAGVNTLRTEARDAYNDVVRASQAGDKRAAEEALRRLNVAAEGLRGIRATRIDGQTAEQIYDKLHDLRYDSGATDKTEDIEHRLSKLLHNGDKTDGFYDGFVDMMDRQLEGEGGWSQRAQRYVDAIP